MVVREDIYDIRKDIFACLFSIHNTTSLHVMNNLLY